MIKYIEQNTTCYLIREVITLDFTHLDVVFASEMTSHR